ncbi:MAG: DUF5666 domain-containing protein [Cellulomonas sp.]
MSNHPTPDRSTPMTDPTTPEPTEELVPATGRVFRRQRATREPMSTPGSGPADPRPEPDEASTEVFWNVIAPETAPRNDGDAADGSTHSSVHGDSLSNDGAGDADADQRDLFSDARWDRPPVANRLTRVLLVAILVVAGFGGGVLLQKSHGTSSTGSVTFAGGFTPGRGAGARPGLGTAPGDAGARLSAAGGTSPAAASVVAPAVVGTVAAVSGATLSVLNFAGATVSVSVPDTATVTTPGLAPLSVGETVSVVGTAAPDGSIVATSVTARTAG